ncbi:chloride channel protein [Liquorilactobacillus satsumensis]|uniref:ClC family H(+)/Cl(-) exchange transporter n=1 Tax=Liquorilactobacillus satsumensis TaxID=259059 RepID=UPI0039E843D5
MKERDLIRIRAVFRGVIVGSLVGLVVSAFRYTISELLVFWKFCYHLAGTSVYDACLVVFGLLCLTWIIGLFITHEKHIMGSGIPEVELQLVDRLQLNPVSVLISKFIAGSLALGTGGFLGREGPSVQLGAAVGQIYAEKIKVSKADWRLLVATGAAAGLSAAFGAPLAGTMFILEEVAHSFSVLLWIEALSGALAADLVTDHFFGLEPVLAIHYSASFPLRYYWILVLLGLLLGGLGIIYQQVTLNTGIFYRFLRWIPRKWQSIVMFVAILPLGIWAPTLLGGGENLIKGLPLSNSNLQIILLLFLVRFVLSTVSFGSGSPGGIFLPILTLGAIIGLAVGRSAVNLQLLPAVYLPNIIIFSLAGYFACISKAPFTAILLIAEMVGSLAHLLPLAFVSLIAYLFVDLLGGAPIYESLAARIGLNTVLKEREKPQLQRVELSVSPAGSFADREVKEIPWPTQVILTRVVRNGNELLGKGDLIIQPGDKLILLVPATTAAAVSTALARLN